MPKCFLHVVDRDLVEVTTIDELRGTALWLHPSFVQFCAGADPGDVFHVQKNEHFVALGASVVAPWLGGAY